MDISSIFAALDARPFKPFDIELVSGTRVTVTHPENVFILPNRHKVDRIEIYRPESSDRRWTFIYPEGITALHLEKRDGES